MVWVSWPGGVGAPPFGIRVPCVKGGKRSGQSKRKARKTRKSKARKASTRRTHRK